MTISIKAIAIKIHLFSKKIFAVVVIPRGIFTFRSKLFQSVLWWWNKALMELECLINYKCIFNTGCRIHGVLTHCRHFCGLITVFNFRAVSSLEIRETISIWIIPSCCSIWLHSLNTSVLLWHYLASSVGCLMALMVQLQD